MRLTSRLAAVAALTVAMAGIGLAPAHAAASITIDSNTSGDGYIGQQSIISGTVTGTSGNKQLNFCVEGEFQAEQTFSGSSYDFWFYTHENSILFADGPGTFDYSVHLVNQGAGADCDPGDIIASKSGTFTIEWPTITVEGAPGGLVYAPNPIDVLVQGYDPLGMTLDFTIWDSSDTLLYGPTAVAVDHYGSSPNFYTEGPDRVSYNLASLGLPAGEYRFRAQLNTTSDALEFTPELRIDGFFTLNDGGDLPGRISGSDRYATAAAIAGVWDAFFDRRDTVPDHPAATPTDTSVAFVATGENFPDALAAAAAATYMGAPLFLTKKGSLPAAVKTRLNALKPDIIYVLGSTAAISNSVVSALQSVSGSPTVQRLQGADRYATMRAIVKKVYGVDGDGDGAELVNLPSIVIATGKNFPDALSAGPAVASKHGAVILVDGSKSSIPSETMKLILDLNPAEIVIAGSTAAVKKGIENQLKATFPGPGDIVKRKAGPDRYATSLAISDHYFGNGETVFFAVGTNFPDALAGAALAGALDGPLIVTPKNCVSSGVKSFVNGQVTPVYKTLFGGSNVISANVASLKVC